jgi:hypothetical protein
MNLTRCVANNNGGTGILVQCSSTNDAEVNVESCQASGNFKGMTARSNSTGVATLRVSNSTMTDNAAIGLQNFGSPAVVLSRGNNTVEGSFFDTLGTIGSYSAK